MGVKDFFVKKLIQSKLKGVPEEQQEMIIALVTENPELFEKIGKEIQQKIKEGKGETAASMEVMRKYQGEIQKAVLNSQKNKK
ncbi:MAG: hypothetical protein NTZ13_03855 [Candidatus Parcubacteria bacterium]|nr:hypothetical protein [Candidatus Parcubacteria bacterium]